MYLLIEQIIFQDITSTAIAVASPPPMQRPATPRVFPYFFKAEISVTRILVPEAPTG
jgi:hypothetical protein